MVLLCKRRSINVPYLNFSKRLSAINVADFRVCIVIRESGPYTILQAQFVVCSLWCLFTIWVSLLLTLQQPSHYPHI